MIKRFFRWLFSPFTYGKQLKKLAEEYADLRAKRLLNMLNFRNPTEAEVIEAMNGARITPEATAALIKYLARKAIYGVPGCE